MEEVKNVVDKNEIKELKERLDKVKYDKLIECLEEIVGLKKYTKKIDTKVNNLFENLKDDEISYEEANKLIKETIKEIEDENLEEELDCECERYNKFTESNPAEFIKYNKSNNYFILTIDKKEKKSKKLEKLIKIKREKIEHDFGKKYPEFVSCKKIKYQDKKVIIYLTNQNKAYFYLNHVVNLLNTKTTKDKYKEYKNEIEIYNIRNNKHGGIYIKEFINQEIFYKILLHSNSKFAKEFKNEIAMILDKLTNNGSLIISNNKLELNENKVELLTNEYIYTQTYDNEEMIDFIKKRIEALKNIGWNKYVKKNVMYCFVTTLDDQSGMNRILCKIGYTYNLINRIISLENEYKCKFYLIGLKLLGGEDDEKEFHKLLKKKYKELSVEFKIGQHNKDEIYVFDINLYKEFVEYQDKVEFSNIEIELEEESKKIMNDYYKNIIERFEVELLKKMTKVVKIENIINKYQREVVLKQNDKYYEYIILKENHRHDEIMIDKTIELKKIELEMLKLQHNLSIKNC
jgi:prophage antirepressor-like protein